MNAAAFRQPPRDRSVRCQQALAAGLGLALALGAIAARADHAAALERCTLEDAQTAEPDTIGHRDNHPGDAAMAAELAHSLPDVTVERPAQGAGPRGGWSPLRFVDHLELGERIRALRRVRLVRLWDNSRLTVFLGFNRAGVAGLHFQQQDPGEPLNFERTALPARPPSLRAVPLDSR